MKGPDPELDLEFNNKMRIEQVTGENKCSKLVLVVFLSHGFIFHLHTV